MAQSDRQKMLNEYLAALNDAKCAAEKLGWRGDVSKINGMISATSLVCIEAQQPASFGAISPLMASIAGVAL